MLAFRRSSPSLQVRGANSTANQLGADLRLRLGQELIPKMQVGAGRL